MYSKCRICGDGAEHLDEFYGKEYYSFSEPEVQEPVISERMETRILDVGCGAGSWLKNLRRGMLIYLVVILLLKMISSINHVSTSKNVRYMK